MSDEATVWDLLSLLLLIGLDLGSITGLVLLINQKIHPRETWHVGLSGMWWLLIVIGWSVIGLLLYKTMLSSTESSYGRFANHFFTVAFSPMWIAGLVAPFLRP